MLYVAELKDIACAPLDLLFTLDEERGLTGVKNLDPTMLRGRTLLNLDSEDDATVTVGCAGGCTTTIQKSERRESPPAGWIRATLSVTGLKGGHSGMDIDKNRLNAIKATVRALQGMFGRRIELRLVTMDGRATRAMRFLVNAGRRSAIRPHPVRQSARKSSGQG